MTIWRKNMFARVPAPLRAGALIVLMPLMAAGESIPVPKGCTAFLTVQSKGCMVEHHFRCARGAPDDQWILVIDEGGPVSFLHVDRNFRWLETEWFSGGVREILEAPEPDPSDMQELLEEGRDTYDFTLRVIRPDGAEERHRYKGFDALTGESVIVDGEELLVVEFELEARDEGGALLERGSGRQYLSRRWGSFFSGAESWAGPSTGVEEGDHAPMEFITGGEPGFLAPRPKYCGTESADYTPPEKAPRAGKGTAS